MIRFMLMYVIYMAFLIGHLKPHNVGLWEILFHSLFISAEMRALCIHLQS